MIFNGHSPFFKVNYSIESAKVIEMVLKSVDCPQTWKNNCARNVSFRFLFRFITIAELKLLKNSFNPLL